jgi:transcriptional regulator with XRE-family HTH domain
MDPGSVAEATVDLDIRNAICILLATMETSNASSATLGSVVAAARNRGGVGVPAGLSVRELARRAGVSAAQVSRIESDQVRRPSHEILVALARALNRNPLPLIILAGHLDAAEARSALAPLFRDDAELPEEWGDWVRYDLETVRRLLTEPDPPPIECLQAIAADMFRVEETDETLWDDSYALAMARGEDAAELRELMGIWRYIGHRRQQLLEYGRALRQLADLEFRAEADQISLAAENPNPSHPEPSR